MINASQPVSTPGSSEFHFLSASNGDFYYFANTSRGRSVSVVQLHLSRPRTRVERNRATRFCKARQQAVRRVAANRRYWFVRQLVRGDRAGTHRSRAISCVLMKCLTRRPLCTAIRLKWRYWCRAHKNDSRRMEQHARLAVACLFGLLKPLIDPQEFCCL